MDFVKAVAIFISSVLASSMVDALMVVSPVVQASINAVLIRICSDLITSGSLLDYIVIFS